jgi:phosphate/sulfate permease
VNGFHDTANAVATVIYTHSLKPTQAVVIVVVANLTENLVYYDSLKAYRRLVYISTKKK